MKIILVSLSISLASLGVYVEQQSGAINPMQRIEHHVNVIQDVVKVDAERQQSQDKILGILQRFNVDMSANTKAAIVDEIIEMSEKYPNLNVDLICATITHESGRSWNPRAFSRAGAMGLMQLMPPTGKWLARIEGIDWTSAEEVLYNPVYNIRMGSRYLSALIEMYDLEGGLAAYNGGGKRAALWLANDKADGILWAETRAYIPHVLKLYAEFRTL